MISAVKITAFFAGFLFFLLVVVPPGAAWLAGTELMKDSEPLHDFIENSEALRESSEALRESWARLLVSLRD